MKVNRRELVPLNTPASSRSSSSVANEGLKDRFFGATEGDEGGPLDVGRQRQASNQAVRLGSKDLGREQLLKSQR